MQRIIPPRSVRWAIALALPIALIVAVTLLWKVPNPTLEDVSAPLNRSSDPERTQDAVLTHPGEREPKPLAQDPDRVEASESNTVDSSAPAMEVRLTITVVNDVGHAVPGARLAVDDPSGFEELTTASDGKLVFTTAHTGEHSLRMEGPPRPTRDHGGHVAAEVHWTPEPGVLTAELVMILPREARILGSLYCTDGSSPRSAGIDIYHMDMGTWSNAAAIEDGTFVSGWMPAGDVIIYSRNGSWSDDDLKERERVTLSCGQSLSYRGALAPAIDLKGTVVDTAGRPLPNVSVDIYDEHNADYSESVISDEEGQFLCDGLYPGGYFLDLPSSVDTPKTHFTVKRGQSSVTMGNLVFRRD